LIRTFWFAAVCLAALGGLLATRVTASMALTGEGVIDPAMLGEAKDRLRDKFQDKLEDKLQDKLEDKLTKDALTKDTLTKADRLDIAYRQAAAVVIAEAPANSIAVAEMMPGANAKPASQLPLASAGRRTSVMLPKPRPKIRLARNIPLARPIAEPKTCAQPEGFGGILLSFAGPPHCG
jgi:hypothetical protein